MKENPVEVPRLMMNREAGTRSNEVVRRRGRDGGQERDFGGLVGSRVTRPQSRVSRTHGKNKC